MRASTAAIGFCGACLASAVLAFISTFVATLLWGGVYQEGALGAFSSAQIVAAVVTVISSISAVIASVILFCIRGRLWTLLGNAPVRYALAGLATGLSADLLTALALGLFGYPQTLWFFLIALPASVIGGPAAALTLRAIIQKELPGGLQAKPVPPLS